jgi:hypothetical protein
MNKKYLRLGYTETTLLFYHWYQQNNETISLNINDGKKTLIKWLYTTSGYYDKQITSNVMDAVHNEIDPKNYIEYMDLLMNIISESDNFHFGVHYNREADEFKKFLNHINIKNNVYMGKEFIFNLIKNKNVLFISPFADLFKRQMENGNLEKIHKDFVKPSNAYFYKNIYTFFNNGPHNNILETVDFLYNDIINNIENNYDLVIVSAGAYSNILANKFYNNNKDILTIGGDLQTIMGILNNRSKKWNTKSSTKLDNEEYWITEIPDEYKPEGFQKIEGGCYW